MLPSAWSTPGTERTRSSSEPGIVGGWAKSSSTATLAMTVTSTPFWARSNRSLKEASIVSVNTNVPATKATPSTTAKPVSTVRSLRAQRPFSAIFSISVGSPQELDDGVGGGLLRVVHDLPVAQDHDPVRDRRGGRVGRHHHHRLAVVVHRVAKEAEYLVRGLRVEVPGRLVGEHHGWAVDQRARHGDALLLATGELGGTVGEAVAEADGADQRVAPLGVGLAPGQRERQQDVLLGGQDR